MTEHILDGVRVLDLSSGLAGPIATQVLAEAGADVVKIEPPLGDPIRTMHPAAFATWNRSKRSIVLDLDDAADRASLLGLARWADVLVHDHRPKHAAKLGLDDESLLAANPRLIVSAITGYPRAHADAERDGYDLLVQARSGLMDFQTGWRDGPFAWRFLVPSWFGGMLALTGIAARLFARERTGLGGPAHTSLLQGVRLAQNMVWSRAENPPPSMKAGPSPALRMPQVAMYECADGKWIQILNPAERVDLSKLPITLDAIEKLGLGDVPFDAGIFAAAITQFPSDKWLEAIRAVDVAVELIAPLGALLDHEETKVNGFVVDVDDPVWGRTRQAGPLFKTEPPMEVRSAAPTVGQHNDALADLLASPQPATAARVPDDRPLLDGVRVLDLGAFLAGPLAPMLLADLGADVIKIEPVRGDPLRGWRDEFYIASNRGKRGLALDITSADGKAILDKLIAATDVVHHNVRIGAASRLGIDDESVRALNPNAVVSHVSAYGVRGSRASWPGYDSVFQAMSGWQVELAGEGNPPLFNHLGNLDMMTGTASAAATALALYHRERTSKGGLTECALLNSATFTNSETLLLLDSGELAPYPHLDHDQTGFGPAHRIYQAADGWVAAVSFAEGGHAALRAVAGVETDEEIVEAFRTRSSADLAAALLANGIRAEIVQERAYLSVWDDDENRKAGVVVSYPQADWGDMQQFGAFWDFGDTPLCLDRACPAVGEHSREVLTQLGYDDAHIDGLVAAGVVASRS